MWDDGLKCRAGLKVELIISATEGSYLYPTLSSLHITTDKLLVPIYRLMDWIAWLAGAHVYYTCITCSELLHDQIQWLKWEYNPG